jgi:hypothetical protein
MPTHLDVIRRARNVELPVFVEAATILVVGLVLSAPIPALYSGRFRIVLLPLFAAVAWSLYKRWLTRRRNWALLTGWAGRPVRREGKFVIQADSSGDSIGRIDTTDHYTVRWERFDTMRALYLISQRDQVVTVSTLASNAADILTAGLQVTNYPCEEWPNLDL